MRSSIDYSIDLGTTNSVIARQDGAQTVLVHGPERERLLPSAIWIDASGKVIVGELARQHRDRDPQNTAIEFKRLMGTEEKKLFPASSRSLTPEEMSAEVLRTLVRWADPKDPPKACVITVPAMFQLPQCEATRRAAELAGILHAPLLQEPIAAAIAYCGSGEVSDGSWIVYDFGGGTFDVSLVRSRQGRLQVLDHDGDNHLGGRDFDRLLVRRLAERIREDGRLGDFHRSDAAHSDAYAKLKLIAERARIDLSNREQVDVALDPIVGGALSVPLLRTEFEGLISPLVERTVRILTKLLARNRMEARALSGVVLVGGPTLTPCVPRMLSEGLGIEVRHSRDPLTIVAMGAALFASTQKLPAHLRTGRAKEGSIEVELEYEPMTTDPSPLLVGKLDAKTRGAAAFARVKRIDGGFQSEQVEIADNRAFAIMLALAKGTLNRFALELLDASGRPLPSSPSELSILHGLSVAKPPLSRSVGIMLANNTVAWYLKKGATLPARNTMTHATTISLSRGQSGDAVNVPMVQGESDRADRNKIIGVLRIHAEKIERDLPPGSQVDVHLTIDEASHTSARAYVPILDQWFDDVVMFRMETKAPEQVEKGLEAQKDRLSELEKMANQLELEDGQVDQRVEEIEQLLEEGDRDSIDLADQLVRRMTEEIDHAESSTKNQVIEASFRELVQQATEIVNDVGNAGEKEQMKALVREFESAMARSDLLLASAKEEELKNLKFRVLQKLPGYWIAVFQFLVEQIKQLGLEAQAASAIRAGTAAAQDQSIPGLHRACGELIALLPSDRRDQVGMPAEVISHLR